MSRDLDHLDQQYQGMSTLDMLTSAILTDFPGKIALVSSFGAESAVLVHLVSQIDPATPILFVDTGKLFGETRTHRDHLQQKLGLTNILTLTADPIRIKEQDPDQMLFNQDPDRCCDLRKTEPLDLALKGYDAWISGRKRFHGGDRSDLPLIEQDQTHIKLNPLANWGYQEIQDYLTRWDLPHHPLVAEGYSSIGCYSCTVPAAYDPSQSGQNIRAGRWQGLDKTECGIHKSPSQQF